jgi:MATE family multidrug resistance protein
MLKQFWQLAIANVLSNLMVPLAGIVDTAFLGHLPEIYPLAGVAIATVIFNVLYWTFGFLRMGTTGLTAQAYGRGDHSAMQLVLLRNGAIALILGGAILALQAPIGAIGFRLLQADAAVRAAGIDFYATRIWGTPAVLLNLVLMGWFLGQSRSRVVILLSLVANLGNVMLDYWFIQRLGWASAGAGAATTLSQGLMLGVGLGVLAKDLSWSDLDKQLAQIWQPGAISQLFRLNFDILIRTFALVLSFALFTHWSAVLGTQVLAANTLLLQVVTLNAYFVDGIAFATESFAGQLYGGDNNAQLRQLLCWGILSSLLLSSAIAVTFGVFTQRLFGLMTQHQEVVNQVQQFVWWLLPTLALGAVAFLLDGYFLGLTAGKTLRNSTLNAALFGFLPLGAIATTLAMPHLLWLALASLMAVRAATLLRCMPATLKRQAV